MEEKISPAYPNPRKNRPQNRNRTVFVSAYRNSYLRIVHSPVSAQGRLIRQTKIMGRRSTCASLGTAAPEQSGQGAEVEAEYRNPSSRRRYCDLLQRQNRLWP